MLTITKANIAARNVTGMSFAQVVNYRRFGVTYATNTSHDPNDGNTLKTALDLVRSWRSGPAAVNA